MKTIKQTANGGEDGESGMIMLSLLAEQYGVKLRLLQTAARFGVIRARKVSGYYWAADEQSVRRFLARAKRRRSNARQGIERAETR